MHVELCGQTELEVTSVPISKSQVTGAATTINMRIQLSASVFCHKRSGLHKIIKSFQQREFRIFRSYFTITQEVASVDRQASNLQYLGFSLLQGSPKQITVFHILIWLMLACDPSVAEFWVLDRPAAYILKYQYLMIRIIKSVTEMLNLDSSLVFFMLDQ